MQEKNKIWYTKTMFTLKNKKGFTLIELLVVISVIGVLATVIITSLGSARFQSEDVKRLSQVKEVQKALLLYNLDHDDYPGSTYSGGWASNCIDAPNQALKYANWQTLISDLDGYLPNVDIDSNWPYCIYYIRGTYIQCDAVANPKYTILFATKESEFPTLDELNNQSSAIIGNAAVRYCMYPILE